MFFFSMRNIVSYLFSVLDQKDSTMGLYWVYHLIYTTLNCLILPILSSEYKMQVTWLKQSKSWFNIFLILLIYIEDDTSISFIISNIHDSTH